LSSITSVSSSAGTCDGGDDTGANFNLADGIVTGISDVQITTYIIDKGSEGVNQ
jgi:hypothetical protein